MLARPGPQLAGAPSHTPKDCGFHCYSRHTRGLLVGSLTGCLQEATSLFLTLMLPFLSLPVSFSKINRHILGRKPENKKRLHLFLQFSWRSVLASEPQQLPGFFVFLFFCSKGLCLFAVIFLLAKDQILLFIFIFC